MTAKGDGALLYFEDFREGETLEFGDRAVSADEIVAFARAWDPQPFHVDPIAARNSQIGELIASGWHTSALTQRMICDAFLNDCATQGLFEVEEIRWLKPLRPGDRLRVRRTTAALHPVSVGLGTISFAFDVYNQRDELVMALKVASRLRRRPEVAA